MITKVEDHFYCLMVIVFRLNRMYVLQGLVSNLFLGKDVLTDWKIYSLDIDGAIAGGWPHSGRRTSFPVPHRDPSVGPVLYMGTLQPNGLARDTFLKLTEWTKVLFYWKGYLMIAGGGGVYVPI